MECIILYYVMECLINTFITITKKQLTIDEYKKKAAIVSTLINHSVYFRMLSSRHVEYVP